ncbi:TerD family protein [Myceligenerans xiligouense]|uniref:TerD family protein n=1 Tax=Myceligenerans xiligouense TaxID=253184 RepID=UPI000F4F1A78|nr:TerD family protein [Myceligenerans xiligouense]
MFESVEEIIIVKSARVPVPISGQGDAAALARQFDVALMSAGFKASSDLLRAVGAMKPDEAATLVDTTLTAVRRSVGDHVRHNAYFTSFPHDVPDTVEFWLSCLRKAMEDRQFARSDANPRRSGVLNLLALPSYGRYQHSYEEMLAEHEKFEPGLTDRLTVLHAGDPVAAEADRLLRRLAASTVPLNDEDRAALLHLARHRYDSSADGDGLVIGEVPMRDTLATLNRVRVENLTPPAVTTVTDVLRLACALSDGDPTLAEPTRLRSFPRPWRRLLLEALDDVVRDDERKLSDVARHRERWKRLGERLHAGQYPQWPHAARVFAVARGTEPAPDTLTARVERVFATSDTTRVLDTLAIAPGMLVRAVDRLLRAAASEADRAAIIAAVERALPDVAGRVALSLREHLTNRQEGSSAPRLFVNRSGRPWSTPDARRRLDADTIAALIRLCDDEVRRRLPQHQRIVVDPDMLRVALPLSGRMKAGGMGTLPRGSRIAVDGDTVRFFTHWREAQHTTDYDLSCEMLDAALTTTGQSSWTSLNGKGFRHSGDITEAPDGASEFIDVNLAEVRAAVLVPQVNRYSGEGFEDAAEAFTGFMVRTPSQKGLPFEPATVRTKSDLAGHGNVSLPMLFQKSDDGWECIWLHLNLRGEPNFNTVEGNSATTSRLVQSVLARRYLNVADLLAIHETGGTPVERRRPLATDDAALLIGLETPEGRMGGCTVVTPANLTDLVPA